MCTVIDKLVCMQKAPIFNGKFAGVRYFRVSRINFSPYSVIILHRIYKDTIHSLQCSKSYDESVILIHINCVFRRTNDTNDRGILDL